MLDFELRFFNENYNLITKKLKKIGAILIQKKNLIEWSSFETQNKDFARVRREANGDISLTVKTNQSSRFVKSYNLIVNDYDEASNLLIALKCKKKYKVQKIREIWKYENKDLIYFDAFPALPFYMELKCNTKKRLYDLANKLDLKINDESHNNLGANIQYNILYGISKNQKFKDDLTFCSIKKNIEFVKKNKELFNRLIKEQKQILRIK